MTFTSGDSSQQLEFTTENSLSSMDFKGDYKFGIYLDLKAPLLYEINSSF